MINHNLDWKNAYSLSEDERNKIVNELNITPLSQNINLKENMELQMRIIQLEEKLSYKNKGKNFI